MKESTRQFWISAIIGILVLIICILVLVTILEKMDERIRKDCAKQDNTGIHHYLDADVDCSQVNYNDYGTSYNNSK